jgi:hypothetical protein
VNQQAPRCPSCGAPDDGEFAYCKFCKSAFSPEILRSAIPCPRCRAACRWGKQKCGACQSWIVVSCVFCGALSPYNQQGCLSCREPFAGAPERKAQRQQQAQHRENMQVAGTVGNVAASFLGAMVGAELGSGGGWGSSSWGNDSPPAGGDGGFWGGGASGSDDSSSGFSEGGGGDFGGGGSGGGDFGGGDGS